MKNLLKLSILSFALMTSQVNCSDKTENATHLLIAGIGTRNVVKTIHENNGITFTICMDDEHPYVITVQATPHGDICSKKTIE